jgi:hypothetical protein
MFWSALASESVRGIESRPVGKSSTSKFLLVSSAKKVCCWTKRQTWRFIMDVRKGAAEAWLGRTLEAPDVCSPRDVVVVLRLVDGIGGPIFHYGRPVCTLYVVAA